MSQFLRGAISTSAPEARRVVMRIAMTAKAIVRRMPATSFPVRRTTSRALKYFPVSPGLVGSANSKASFVSWITTSRRG